ncbi:4-carboxy-4-hydroxy-2-oxoadipate aldolase/oxaloacetate decarboxylase [Deinococcus alpinitundrae]|uniref:4-carboxy-4-hydroxy-2-oxoadipate aldolase/oxaloacetate decarboxylase n=1 Tax=Deinococcus alpinitundrae TaxID=468913 RepID=UPI00137A2511|nr:4-carboxy-4-hydroxy-2-oxoadipate aldolase/oxaloacetate decarboxylase [Deinococcus alpinitundrae]
MVNPQEFLPFGVSTVYEASGRQGLVDTELHQVIPGSRVCGAARTVMCAQDDNLMVHAAMGVVRPGEVLVLVMPEETPVALVGDLLATQAQGRGVAAMLIGAAVRDIETLREMGLPIWTRYVRSRGARRVEQGQLNVPVTLGGAPIRTGDYVLMDADGAVVIPRERLSDVLDASRVREQKEAANREKFQSGTLSIDLYGLRGELAAHLREP